MMVDAPFGERAEKVLFRRRLFRWFDREKRDLPWRGESDPYRILVSEVMLQQTRVAVVEQRYGQFLRRFPTVEKLARAREQSVLAAWSGLGYYRRARALHSAARKIARQKKFPRRSVELMDLPGIGRYTACAVASIAYGEPVPVVDGNVRRVLTRLLAHLLSDDQCWETAGELLDTGRPGDFNQAMMELGALVCLPGKPICTECPVAALCRARGVSGTRKPSSRQKALLNYSLIRRNGSVLLRQRAKSLSLMPGMWELPSVEDGATMGCTPLLTLRHSITTTDYVVRVFAAKGNVRSRGRWVLLAAAERLPLTGLTRKILRGIPDRNNHS
jgi:A/G-specific adenine glycosylase